MKIPSLFLSLCVGVLILYGCVSIPNTKTASSLSGRELYEKKCQVCHSLIDPKSKSDNEWHIAVRKYRRKANLSSKEQKKILEYLLQNNNN